MHIVSHCDTCRGCHMCDTRLRCHTCHKRHFYVSLVIKCVIGSSLVTNFNKVLIGGGQKVIPKPSADSFGRRQKGFSFL
jgi:hypothetical protein